MKSALFGLILSVFSQWVSALESVSQPEYVGAKTCKNCHSSAYSDWIESDHYMAMQPAQAPFVKGDFSGAEIVVNGITSRFFIRDNIYTVATANENNRVQEYPIKYTFGHYPLQQYLIELDNGFIQALNIAWDSRPQSEGGQQWYHLRENEKLDAEHPFFWTRHFQNWNSRCADCHSTNVEKNYDVNRHAYNTTWSEINVACEACHGPASKHVALAENSKLSKNNNGFALKPSKGLTWSFVEGDPIAKAKGEPGNSDSDMCGGCHSLRTQLSAGGNSDQGFSESYHDRFHIQLIQEPAYFADGQIRDEVFVLGSFLQSKMYKKGVSCTNCHNPHSGKVLIEGNGLCAQCHQPSAFDTPAHHHHQQGSSGSACVNCHMPATTYMGVDARRDHNFSVPNPAMLKQMDTPIACKSCHQNEMQKSATWLLEQMKSWGLTSTAANHWGYLNHRVSQADVLVTREISDLLLANPLPDIVQASLLAGLAPMPSRVSVELAQDKLSSISPLERRAAVESLQNLPLQMRWQILAPLLNDKNRSVRFTVAEVLADTYMHLSEADQAKLKLLLDEYRLILKISADTPATQLAIANLELRLGDPLAAENAFSHALKIEPNYVPALINMADYFRTTNREEKAEPLLLRAIKVAPDSGGAQHSYGLFLIRKRNYQAALPHLKSAVLQNDAIPRYAFVYAVALDSQGKTKLAVEVLQQANLRWPNQYDLLLTQIGYLEKLGETNAVLPLLSRLSAIAPNSPEVKALIGKYSR